MAKGEKRSDRMRSIEALAARESRDLAARMEHQANSVREAQTRLDELTDYLDGYVRDQADKNREGGLSAMQLTETHLFLERLREAVNLQKTVVEKARSRYESCRAHWIAQHVRTSALGSVVHRFEAEETREVVRREERMADEIAARYHRIRQPD